MNRVLRWDLDGSDGKAIGVLVGAIECALPGGADGCNVEHKRECSIREVGCAVPIPFKTLRSCAIRWHRKCKQCAEGRQPKKSTVKEMFHWLKPYQWVAKVAKIRHACFSRCAHATWLGCSFNLQSFHYRNVDACFIVLYGCHTVA